MSDRKKTSKTQNNNEETSSSYKKENKGRSCTKCHESRKKCDRTRPRCSRCVKGGYECIYTKNIESTLLSKVSEVNLLELDRQVQNAQQLNLDLDEEVRRLMEEIERMKRARTNLVVRSVTLYKCSKLVFLLNCYMPALQPTTGNQVPYIKISHFFRDTNPARQGAMYAMLANAALMLEDTQLAARFTAEAKNCLKIVGEPSESNMALVVSAMIDIGTQHQAFFNFEDAIEIYYKIRDYAEKYPHLFLPKKANEPRAFTYQGERFQVSHLQETDHYPGLFREIRAKNSGYGDSNNNSPTSTKIIEDDDDSDADLNPEDDGKTTYAVPSFALPRTAQESLFFHLGYAFEALMLMTRDDELEAIRDEIKKSNQAKLGEHNVFNEIRERLQDLNQMATYCLKRGLVMKWEWFKGELNYIERRLLEIEMGRRIFLHGQLQLVVIHGLMAAHKKQDALPLLDQLIKFGEQQFHYGKTNVLGFGYLFSACVCYHFLGEEDSFYRTRDLIASYRVPDVPLAEKCLIEIEKFVTGKEKELAPYFAKMAAILDVGRRVQQTKFTLLEITDLHGQLTEEARHYFGKECEFKGHMAFNNNDNNNNIQPQGPLSCESSPNVFYEADQHQTPYSYSPSNTNTQNAYNSNMPFVPSPSHHHTAPDPAYGSDHHLQRQDEHTYDNFHEIMHTFMPGLQEAPHLAQNTQQIQIGNNDLNLAQFYVVDGYATNNNNNNTNLFDLEGRNDQNQASEAPAELFNMDPFEQDQDFQHFSYEDNMPL